jgi:hypothetical protein
MRATSRVFSERDAFGADEYHPLSQKGSNLTAAGGIGYTIADSLDTIIIMQQQGYNFDGEYERARGWIENTLSFDRNANFNTFEVRLILVYRFFGNPCAAADNDTCAWGASFGSLFNV